MPVTSGLLNSRLASARSSADPFYAGGNAGGSSTLTSITNNAYADYNKRFKTYEAQTLAGPDEAQMRSDASARVNSAFGGAPDQIQRQRFETGTGTADATVGASDKRQTSLARSIADVDGQNRAITEAADERKTAAATAFDFMGQDLSSARSLASNVAGNEASRQAQYIQDQAAQDASQNSMIGTGVGIIATIAIAF